MRCFLEGPPRFLNPRRHTMRALTLTALASLLVPISSAQAQSTWLGGSGNSWNTGANWSGGSPPSGDNVTNTLNQLISFDSGLTSILSFVGSGGGEFDVTGGTLNVSGNFTNTGAVVITGTGLLNVSGTLTAGSLSLAGPGFGLEGAGDSVNGGMTSEIENATIANTAISVGNSPTSDYLSADLNKVTFGAGTSLNLGVRGQVIIDNGLSFTNAALNDTATGGVQMTMGYQSVLLLTATDAAPNQTLGATTGHVTITTIQDNADISLNLYSDPNVNGTLTLASDLTINMQSQTNEIRALNLVNNGTIDVGSSSRTTEGEVSAFENGTTGNDGSFINNGTLEATAANATLYVAAPYAPFTNNGTIAATNGGVVVLQNVSKLGNVTIDGNANSAVVASDGLFTPPAGYQGYSFAGQIFSPTDLSNGVRAQYGGGGFDISDASELLIPSGGSFDVTSINLPDGTHDPSTYGLLHLGTSAWISGGTLLHSDLLLFASASTGILNNVALSGDNNVVLNVTTSQSNTPAALYFPQYSTSVYLQNNVTFPSGSIFNVGTVGGNSAAFLLFNSENTTDTINPVIGVSGGTTTINLGSANSTGGVGYGNTNPPEAGTTLGPTLPFYYTLTVGAGTTIQGTGEVGSNDQEAGSGDILVNNGTITADIANKPMTVSSGPDNVDGSISHASSLVNNGTIQATTSGTQLNVISGTIGSVTNGANAVISATGGSTITVSGVVSSYEKDTSAFINTGELLVGAGSVINLNNATSTQTAGATIVDGNLVVFNPSNDTYTLTGGTLNGVGALSANVNVSNVDVFAGDKNIVTGTVTPGVLTVSENYNQSGGTFETAIGAGGVVSTLDVDGSVSLGNTAKVGLQLVGGYVPSTIGQSYEIVLADADRSGGGLTGSFSNPLGPLSLIADSTTMYDFSVVTTSTDVSLVYRGIGGSSMAVPLLPSSTSGLSNIFKHVSNGAWIDPLLASGYTLQTTDGSLFTGATLPSGFSEPFTVYVGNTDIGTFSSGSTVSFAGLLGGGTDEFSITGIDPGVDSSDATAFPVETYFNDASSAVTMTAITGSGTAPEPGALALLAGGLSSLALGFVRRFRQPA